MRYISIISAALCSSSCVAQTAPLDTNGRFIVDENGQRVKFKGVNWAGHLEPNIPEGLQYRTVDDIAAFISSQGFNMVRLTYSIDMALAQDYSVKESFSNAATVTSADLDSTFSTAVGVNPFLSSACLIDVYGTIVDALASHNIMVVMDNQMSREGWCCSLTDGNGWWDQASGYNASNSQYFNTDKWVAGLSAIATWAKDHKNVAGVSVRNELRAAGSQDPHDWYTFVPKGADAIHGTNPDLLITIGGTSYANDLSFLDNEPLETSAWSNKVVWELHEYDYQNANATTDCASYQSEIDQAGGFVLTAGQPYTGPLWLSEFGAALSGGNDTDGLAPSDLYFFDCISQYLTGNDADWAIWALQGSYYVRNNQMNFEETYGVFNKDWSAARNPNLQAVLGGMFDTTQGP